MNSQTEANMESNAHSQKAEHNQQITNNNPK